MNLSSAVKPLLALLLTGAALTPIGGCTYDYLNRQDRVTFAAGDAVRSNLERETADPTSRSRYSVKGLGKNGKQIPEEASATPTAAPAP
jgi:hypothetical protein